MRVSLGQAAPPGPSSCRSPPGDPTCTRRKAAPQDREATGEKVPAPSQLDLDVKETETLPALLFWFSLLGHCNRYRN